MKKYLRLMADHCSSGFWDEDGANLDPENLPVFYWLKRMIEDWQAVYDREAMDMDKFDVKTFSKNGYALAVKLKQNLPDWTIMYYDEAAAWENKTRSEFLKEIVL